MLSYTFPLDVGFCSPGTNANIYALACILVGHGVVVLFHFNVGIHVEAGLLPSPVDVGLRGQRAHRGQVHSSN